MLLLDKNESYDEIVTRHGIRIFYVHEQIRNTGWRKASILSLSDRARRSVDIPTIYLLY